MFKPLSSNNGCVGVAAKGWRLGITLFANHIKAVGWLGMGMVTSMWSSAKHSLSF
jgi:hypothetical protein